MMQQIQQGKKKEREKWSEAIGMGGIGKISIFMENKYEILPHHPLQHLLETLIPFLFPTNFTSYSPSIQRWWEEAAP